MTVNRKIVGTRLQNYRKALNLRQDEVSQETNISQVAISKLENGLGGTLESFLVLFNFYSEKIDTSDFFKEEYSILKSAMSKNALKIKNNLALKKLQLTEKTLLEEFEEIKNMLKI